MISLLLSLILRFIPWIVFFVATSKVFDYIQKQFPGGYSETRANLFGAITIGGFITGILGVIVEYLIEWIL